jgi:hypothetical protein
VSDYRRVLEWWLNLLHTLVQCLTTLYISPSHTYTIVHSHVFTAVALYRLPLPMGSRNVPGLSYQLSTARAHNDRTPAILSLSLLLRPTISPPVCLGIMTRLVLTAIFVLLSDSWSLLMWGALSDEKTGLSFTIAPVSRQRSHFRVRVPWDSWSYFTVSDSRLPCSSPPTGRSVRWRHSTPPPHGWPSNSANWSCL